MQIALDQRKVVAAGLEQTAIFGGFGGAERKPNAAFVFVALHTAGREEALQGRKQGFAIAAGAVIHATVGRKEAEFGLVLFHQVVQTPPIVRHAQASVDSFVQPMRRPSVASTSKEKRWLRPLSSH